jgi:hypothetical protein
LFKFFLKIMAEKRQRPDDLAHGRIFRVPDDSAQGRIFRAADDPA